MCSFTSYRLNSGCTLAKYYFISLSASFFGECTTDDIEFIFRLQVVGEKDSRNWGSTNIIKSVSMEGNHFHFNWLLLYCESASSLLFCSFYTLYVLKTWSVRFNKTERSGKKCFSLYFCFFTFLTRKVYLVLDSQLNEISSFKKF